MLLLQALNHDAQLNDFRVIGNINMMNGEDITVVLRIIDSDKNLRYISESGASFSIDLQKSDGTTINKVPVPFVDDRSIVSFEITSLESVDLIGQNLIMTITESGKVKKAILQGGLQKSSIGVTC